MVREPSKGEGVFNLCLSMIFLFLGLMIFVLGGMYGFGSGNVAGSLISMGVMFLIPGICLLIRSLVIFSAVKPEKHNKSRYDVQHVDIQHIHKYNNPDHRFYKEITEAINTLSYNLEANPKMDVEFQMQILGINSYDANCPFCHEKLFLFKKFLVYCMNCKLFISELP